MSVIVDFMVVSSFGDEDRMEEVNRELYQRDTERHQQFRKIPVDDFAGGAKVFCTDAWAGAFNHLVPEEIREAICAAEWPFPDCVLVLEYGGDYDIPLRSHSVKELRRSLTNRLSGDDEWPYPDEDPPDPL